MAEPYIIKMPKLSDTMEEGTIVTWEKNVGDFIERGTIVATVETDKAIMDVEVFREGYLSASIDIDSVVPVGTTIAYLVENESDVQQTAASVDVSAATEMQSTETVVEESVPAPAMDVGSSAPEGAYLIKMPKLSDTMEEGTIVTWEKEIGDKIERGDVVATVETDKAIMDVEIFREGYLSGPQAETDSVIEVGAVMGYLVKNAASVVNKTQTTPITLKKAEQVSSDTKPIPAGTVKAKTQIAAMPSGATPAPRPRSGKATPYARQLAGAHGIDLNSIIGSGVEGVIVAADVMNSNVQKTSTKRIFQVAGEGRA
ncbi:E3 binding domain-containing protein, partial [Beggiatoa alba]|nr:E3 binding domain-containing protein [Beggiatoa alba]